MSTTLPLFPKIPRYRRGADLLHSVCRVVCLEKLDGTNTRVLIPRGATAEGDLVFGSRTQLLSEHNHHTRTLRESFLAPPGTAARCLSLAAELDRDVVLFGETVGRGIQAQGFRYGPRPRFILFAATIDGAWLSLGTRLHLIAREPLFEERPTLRELASRLGLTLAPVLYEGPPDEAVFDSLIAQPSAFARLAGRSDAPQEGIVIWSDPLLFDGAGSPLVAKHKDPRCSEVVDREGEELEAPYAFAERVVGLERLRHARQHLMETGRWRSVWGERVRLLEQRVIQDVARELPEYQEQIRVRGKDEIRDALRRRVDALLPVFELEE